MAKKSKSQSKASQKTTAKKKSVSKKSPVKASSKVGIKKASVSVKANAKSKGKANAKSNAKSSAKPSVKTSAKKTSVKTSAPKNVAKASAKKVSAKASKKAASSKPQRAVAGRLGKAAANFFSPLWDYVVLEKLEAEVKTPGGLFIPETALERPNIGEVVAVGRGLRSKKGNIRPLDVEVGDRVFFSKYSGTEVQMQGRPFLFIKETDIIGVTE